MRRCFGIMASSEVTGSYKKLREGFLVRLHKNRVERLAGGADILANPLQGGKLKAQLP